MFEGHRESDIAGAGGVRAGARSGESDWAPEHAGTWDHRKDFNLDLSEMGAIGRF